MTRSALSKVSTFLGKIRQPSRNSFRKLARSTDLPSDDSWDPLQGPSAKVWQWMGLVRALVKTEDDYRLDLITWSDSDGEESELYWTSDLSTPTTEDTILSIGNLKGKMNKDIGSDKSYLGSSDVHSVSFKKSSAFSGIDDVTNLGLNFSRKWKRIKTGSRKKENGFCAVRASIETGTELNQGQTLRKKMGTWVARARMMASKKWQGVNSRTTRNNSSERFRNTIGMVAPPPQREPRLSQRAKENAKKLFQKTPAHR